MNENDVEQMTEGLARANGRAARALVRMYEGEQTLTECCRLRGEAEYNTLFNRFSRHQLLVTERDYSGRDVGSLSERGRQVALGILLWQKHWEEERRKREQPQHPETWTVSRSWPDTPTARYEYPSLHRVEERLACIEASLARIESKLL